MHNVNLNDVNEMKNYKNSQWIKQCEDAFAKQIGDVTDDICKNKNIRIIRLYGPSCSGKTTTARLLTSNFKRHGKRVHVISIDDFYYNRDKLRAISKAKGLSEIDYDSPDTIDCEELSEFIREIFNEDEVRSPIFDFKTGMRSGYKTIKIDDRDIFIFEGIQAVYPEVIAMFEKYESTSIYISPQREVLAGGACFEANEIRFMRRLVRDNNFRGSTPEEIFDQWDGVRSNEEINIFPYVHESKYKINSSMPYEIGILKPYLDKLLGVIDKENPHYSVAMRILERIELVEPIPSKLILNGYLYKEFV